MKFSAGWDAPLFIANPIPTKPGLLPHGVHTPAAATFLVVQMRSRHIAVCSVASHHERYPSGQGGYGQWRY